MKTRLSRHFCNVTKAQHAAIAAAFAICGAGGLCASSSTTLPSGVTLRQIDGGANYFSQKSPKSAWMDKVILLGGWMLEPMGSTQVQYDIDMGNNIYWTLAGNPSQTTPCGGSPCRASYSTILAGGMHAIAPEAFTSANDQMDTGATNSGLINGSETVGWMGSDESDMMFGPGWAAWTGGTAWGSCAGGTSSQCGYTVDQFYYSGNTGAGVGSATLNYPFDGRIVYQNYGKGVLFWETQSQAAAFMNYSDILSADAYWSVDTDIQLPSQGGCALLPNDSTVCRGGAGTGLSAAQSQLAANYEYNINRLRQLQALAGSSKPAVAFVETGCPGSNNKCTTPDHFTAAAWHSIIAGARGIVWFQHNFSGPCVDYNVFYDGSDPSSSLYKCEISPYVKIHNIVKAVKTVNKRITALNDVLLSPFADGYVSASGTVSLMTKYNAAQNAFYVFAGSGQPGVVPAAGQKVTFTLAGAPSVTIKVLHEDRTISAVQGTFTDFFDDANTIHIYKIPNSLGSSASNTGTSTTDSASSAAISNAKALASTNQGASAGQGSSSPYSAASSSRSSGRQPASSVGTSSYSSGSSSGSSYIGLPR